MNEYVKLGLKVALGGILYSFYGLFSMIVGVYVGNETQDVGTQAFAIIICLVLGGFIARKVYLKSLLAYTELHKYSFYIFCAILLGFWGLAELMLVYHSLTFVSFMDILMGEHNQFGLERFAFLAVAFLLLLILMAYFFVTFLCAAAAEWFCGYTTDEALNGTQIRPLWQAVKAARKAHKAYKNEKSGQEEKLYEQLDKDID